MDSGMPVRAVWISDGGPHTHWDRHTGATKKIDITPLEMALYDKNCIKAIEQAGVTCERIFLEFFCAIMRTLEKAHKHSLSMWVGPASKTSSLHLAKAILALPSGWPVSSSMMELMRR
ncbi:hypothetical protein HBI56_225560 [Parastagonospora nodorum]|nr:hypothetical protein HBH54_236860 [Parastagonospora nodorum]KAH3957869.1 hypothetical protein HBH51_217330 [Parastagonospora nodorum]KAH3967297.1 hypothetical protein HBH52_186560 [Parastagonospora nodorum]KAH3994065.1 hypothetical protein HBI10_192070 [Parastagonospora nodorum]KAH4013361.1 hypothetical protein HBI09_216960 [Parastagonospora nodorum]